MIVCNLPAVTTERPVRIQEYVQLVPVDSLEPAHEGAVALASQRDGAKDE